MNMPTILMPEFLCAWQIAKETQTSHGLDCQGEKNRLVGIYHGGDYILL